MEEIIFTPDDYYTILLTNDIRDKNVCRDLKECCELGDEEEIEPIFVIPSNFYDGFLIIDGNHRSITLGKLEKEIRGYIINSNYDRKKIEKLGYYDYGKPTYTYLEEFLNETLNLQELVQISEEAHEEDMYKLSLADYLEANE